MKKIKSESFYDLLFMFYLAIYILGVFILRRLISKTFSFVYIKYNFNIFLFTLSLIFLMINICVIFSKQNKRLKYQNKRKTKKLNWSKGFLIAFRIYFLISNILILFSIMNTVFSRYELTFTSVKKYNLFNKLEKEYSIDSFSHISITPSIYTSRQGKSFRVVIKLYGEDNFVFTNFRNRKNLLTLLQNIKKQKKLIINSKEIDNFYKSNVIYWSLEEQDSFKEIFVE